MRWPETAIIVCSGREQDVEGLPEEARFIAKPCIEPLMRKVLDALRLR